MLLISPTTVFGHKPWSSYDLAKLALSYKQGYSIKMISQVLSRSMTATNKAITRHGLRNQFGRKKYFTNQPLTPSIDNLIRDLKPISDAEDQDNAAAMLSNAAMTPPQPPKCAIRSDFDISGEKLAVRIKPEEIVNFVKFSHLIKELKTTGATLTALDCPHHKRHGYDYLLNKQAATRADVLIFLNKRRLQAGLSIYHLNEITLD